MGKANDASGVPPPTSTASCGQRPVPTPDRCYIRRAGAFLKGAAANIPAKEMGGEILADQHHEQRGMRLRWAC
jgi:hypothetical protein